MKVNNLNFFYNSVNFIEIYYDPLKYQVMTVRTKHISKTYPNTYLHLCLKNILRIHE